MNRLMRGLLVLVLIAFLGSSFASAAHAFDQGDCNPQTQTSTDSEIAASTDTDSKAPCLDCHHCCVSHVLPQSAQPITMASVDTPLNPLRLVTYTGEYYGSLLRPPKSLA